MKPFTPLLSILALAVLAAGCRLPTMASVPYTVTQLLSGGPAHLIPLAGTNPQPISLSGQRSAFLVFDSQAQAASALTVAINPGSAASALRTPMFGAGLGIPVGPAGLKGEAALRAYNARFRGLKPAATRHVLQQAPLYQVGAVQHFWMIGDAASSDPSQDRQVTATVAYVGSHCYVFLDQQATDPGLASRIQQMGQTFDQKIYPTDSRVFGAPLASGVNGDPRITLLVTPAVGSYGQDDTIGYFTPRDLYSPSSDPSDPSLAHSNQRLMLYVSSSVVTDGLPTDYLGTIAHEFQHLINASNKLFAPGATGQMEDTWLDEGLAMYAMEANGYGLSGGGSVVFDHVDTYEQTSASYSLTDWGNDPDQSAYGAVYLFVTYLVDHFGEGLLTQLVASHQTGVANVDAHLQPLGTNFQRVFNDWTVANLVDHSGLSGDPRYNYKTINMLGTYGGSKLQGMALAPVQLPNTGKLDLMADSAQYFYVPRGTAGTFNFQLTGAGLQNFSGLVVAP